MARSQDNQRPAAKPKAWPTFRQEKTNNENAWQAGLDAESKRNSLLLKGSMMSHLPMPFKDNEAITWNT